ncbi:helix-turn-helix transcriptional regulator [Polymorphospora rubra]|uniref:ArsR/SmtB family transcription factor n=1 Tax=Polymorphospora rubra TaxID=338584 RepID=UPI0033D00D67
MISLRLDEADLRRIRFGDRPHPVGTAIMACQALRDPALAGLMPALAVRTAAVAEATRPLRHLLPARGLLPDFLTPYVGLASLDAGLDEIRATPRDRVRAEVSRAYTNAPASLWRRRFADGDPQLLDLVTVALRLYFDAVLAPDWPHLELAHRGAVARAAETYALAGVDGLLAGLHPAIRWRPPVLEVDTWWDADLAGTGEGLLLVPSPLAGLRPRVLVEPGLPVLLVYPAPTGSAASGADPLTRLLGRTRAAVLRHLAQPGRHTTTTLGRHARVSVSSASEHASALRAAGLVASDRVGGAVVHRVTPLGYRLLGHGEDPS